MILPVCPECNKKNEILSDCCFYCGANLAAKKVPEKPAQPLHAPGIPLLKKTPPVPTQHASTAQKTYLSPAGIPPLPAQPDALPSLEDAAFPLSPPPEAPCEALPLSSKVINDRYRYVRPIIQSSRGSLYKADDPEEGKTVIIREICENIRSSEAPEQRVQAMEIRAKLLMSLEYLGIPKILDFFAQSNRSYLVVECIEGHDLEGLMLQEGPLPDWTTVVKKWFLPLLGILDYLHEHEIPVSYNSINLSDLMLDTDDHFFLTDFGFSHFLRRDIEPQGPRLEEYALSALLYHLLTGINPKDPLKKDFGIPDLQLVRPDIPTPLRDLIMAMLNQESFREPMTRDEIRKTLTEFLALPKPERPTLRAPDASPGSSFQKIQKKKPPGEKSTFLRLIFSALISLGILIGSAQLFTLMTGFSFSTMLHESTKIIVLISASFLLFSLILIFSGYLNPDMIVKYEPEGKSTDNDNG